MIKRKDDLLPIGALADRTGLAVSAIRFYEARGLVSPMRNAGGQRRFRRSDIRRLSFIVIAQRLGLTIGEICDALAGLPQGRTPTARDWAVISTRIKSRIQARIDELERMRDRLDGCIGCGCLSLEACALYNADDVQGADGPGPRRIL